jgi:hypothetical protein|tara:strand:- start:186 stop:386 length:201 start_codon:yes stop_codon:yes gene_type:complete
MNKNNLNTNNLVGEIITTQIKYIKTKQNKKDQKKEWSNYQNNMKDRIKKGLEPISIYEWRGANNES